MERKLGRIAMLEHCGMRTYGLNDAHGEDLKIFVFLDVTQCRLVKFTEVSIIKVHLT
jgi:hypothetical protein